MQTEEKTKGPSYFDRVFEIWLMLTQYFGIFGGLGLAYMFFRVQAAELDFVTGLSALLFGVGSASLVIFFISMAAAALTGIDQNRVQKWESEGNVLRLVQFIHSAGVPSNWKIGCETLVRVGNSAVPLLIESLDPMTCPVKNPFGRDIPSNADLRAGAAYCLGKLHEHTALQPLSYALVDEEWVVRMYAAQSLGEIGDESSVGILRDAMKDDANEQVRDSAKQALEKIGTQEG